MAKTVNGLDKTVKTALDNDFAPKSHTHSNYVSTNDLAQETGAIRQEVSEIEQDIVSNMGSLSGLNTSAKGNLVAAINEVFQSGVSAKQKLVDALIANGEAVSTSDSWDTLISKISGGGSQEIDLTTHIIKNNALNSQYSFYNIGTRWWHNTTNGLYSQNISGTTYAFITTNQKINFNNYHTIKVTAKNTGAGSKGFKLWVADSPLNATSTSDNAPNYSTDYGVIDTSYYTQSFDISSWNCEGYLAITRYIWSNHSFYISDIELIGSVTVNTKADIISATALPATGQENQICVITDNPVNDFIISPNEGDYNGDTNTIFALTSTGGGDIDPVISVSNGLKTYYYFDKMYQGSSFKPSYIYKNGAWQEYTPAEAALIKNGALVTDAVFGGLYYPGEYGDGSSEYVRATDAGVVMYFTTTYSYYYWGMTSNKAIDFSKFSTIEITLTNMSSKSDGFYVGIGLEYGLDDPSMYAGFGNSYHNEPATKKKTSAGANGATKTVTIDISSWTATGFFVICYWNFTDEQKLRFSDIIMY